MPHRTCHACGGSFVQESNIGRPRKYCLECSVDEPKRECISKTCGHCGEMFLPVGGRKRSWCYRCLPAIGTIDAKPWMRQQGNLKHFSKTTQHGRCCSFDHIQVGPPAPFYCAVCRSAHWGPHKAYCKACNGKRLTKTTKRNVGHRPCNTCGWSFSGRPSDYCSDKCSLIARTNGLHGTPPNSTRLHHIHCVKCGEFVGVSRRHSPSAYCATHRREGARDRNRRKNYKRRKNGGSRGIGRYTLAGIAKRDNYKCHLCTKKVDMALPGTDPQGPTIDHLIPWSEGGPDTPDNVRLAHNYCNCKRGTGGAVQLMLVA